MHPTIWKASGHVDAFNDPLIDNKDSKKRYRADVLIEDQIAKYDEKIEKDVEKARKRFGEKFDEALFRETNPQIQEHIRKREALHERMSNALNANDLNEVRQIILDEKIVCPISGTCNWTEVRQFNLMFATEMGVYRRRSQQNLPASRNSSGNLRQFSECTENRTHESAFWYRSDR